MANLQLRKEMEAASCCLPGFYVHWPGLTKDNHATPNTPPNLQFTWRPPEPQSKKGLTVSVATP